MSTTMSDPTGAAQRPKPKGIDQATNPRWATAKIAARCTIIVLSFAASITSFAYCAAPRRWDDWILLSPLYGLAYVSPLAHDLQDWETGGMAQLGWTQQRTRPQQLE